MKDLYRPVPGATALVAGDLVLDCYIQGCVERISPEAPVPVLRVRDREYCPGGAGNVARNLAAAGIATRLVGVCGEDSEGQTLEGLLSGYGVQCRFRRCEGLATIIKSRVIAGHQQLLRLDEEEALTEGASTRVFEDFRASLDWAGIAILSDYGKGALQGAAAFISACRERDLPVLVDPKGDDFSDYRGATVITPNRAELERVVGSCPDLARLHERGERLRAELDLRALLITRGEQGMSLLREGQPLLELPAVAHEVFDVTGAGDTVIALLAAGLVSGYSLEDATAIANRAAGLVVSRLGTVAAGVEELNYHRGSKLVSDMDRFAAYLQRLRAAGRRVVMTNGCFDLLHAGHTRYLQEAASLGDCLIVAVNDDGSVRRLKGDGRPIMPLEQRLEALMALECVDWLVSFAEDAPDKWIEAFSPDLLVKGGDYQVGQIAGAEFVLKRGGQVKTIPLTPGCSSSLIIERIRNAGGRA